MNHWNMTARTNLAATTDKIRISEMTRTVLEAMQPTVSVFTDPTLTISSRHSAMRLSPADWRTRVTSRPRTALFTADLRSRSCLKRRGTDTWVSLNQFRRSRSSTLPEYTTRFLELFLT